MFKKILLILLFSANPYALKANDCRCDLTVNEPSLMKSIIILSAVGAGAVAGTVIMAPVVIPAAALSAITAGIVATKGAIVAGGTYVASWLIPTTTVEYVGTTLTVIKHTRPYIIQTTEEKRDQLLEEKAQEQYTKKDEFITCLRQNKFGSARNAAGRPSACEEMAYAYAFVAGNAELNRRTKAFKEGKCFCS